MLLVVGVAADFPEVGAEGFLAVGCVLLGRESGLVGGEGGQVVLACLDRCRNGCETLTSCEFVVGGVGFPLSNDPKTKMGTNMVTTSS